MPTLTRVVLLLLFGFALCVPALASDAAPDALHPSARIVHSLPRAASPTLPAETPPELSLQVGVGRFISTGLVATGTTLAVLGGVSLPVATGYQRYGSIALMGLGAVVGGVGAGVALGTSTALKRDGGRVSVVPGWIAVGALGVGTTLLLASNGNGAMIVASAATIPVILAGGLVQVALNNRSRRRLLLGIRPTEGGGMATLQARF